MIVGRKGYVYRYLDLGVKAGPEAAMKYLEEALNEVQKPMLEYINEQAMSDLPLIIAVLELMAQSMRSTHPMAGPAADDILKTTTTIAYEGKPEPLKRTADET